MAFLLEDKGRPYKRIRPSSDEKIKLADKGMQWVLSSNVSAVGSDGDDLIIRFHNSSLYKYPDRGHLLDDILRAPSKGKWVWIHLRRKNAKYSKIGSMPLSSDNQLTDDELFNELETQGIRVEEPQVINMNSLLVSSLLKITLLDEILGNPIDIIGTIRQTQV